MMGAKLRRLLFTSAHHFKQLQQLKDLWPHVYRFATASMANSAG